ncbi:MAG: right-handed parallel beta-helix repeat-containing protein, partial [Methylophagaceae bacterium]
YTASNNTATHTLIADNGCDSIVSLDLTINYSPVFSFASDTISACNTDSVLVDAGAGYNFYAWSNGANTQQIYATQNRVYAITVTDANGCSDNDNVLVDILNVNIIQSDTSLCLGDSLLISIDTLSNLKSNSPNLIIVPNDFATIQSGINAANSNDTIVVMPGIYNENILWENKNLVIKSYSGRDHTIIDGQNLNNVFKISGVDSTSLLEGFTIRNGDAFPNGASSYPLNCGGGIILYGTTDYIQLKNLIIEQCNGDENGSGIYLRAPAKATLENLIIQNNLNGGIELSSGGSHAILHDVLISDNGAKEGVFIYDSGIDIYNSEISDNNGGAINFIGIGYLPSKFEDVLFTNNQGGISFAIADKYAEVTNCTFYNNKGNSDIYSSGSGNGNNIVIENSIFYENPPNSSRVAISVDQNADPLAKDSIYVSYCIFNEDTASSLTQSADAVNFWSVNNVFENTDPLFIDAANNNFDLLASSPGIDAGNPASPLDADGSVSDIGHNFSGADYTHTTPNINLGANTTYSWSTGETTAAIHPTPTQTTTYYVTATNGITTCEDSLTITVLPTS